ncbi:MAG: FAD-dependent oxidoreductase [Actinobacteria bacterium]|nr:FAD-dependent oxidoreductase [Actinomycetota bacterium]
MAIIGGGPAGLTAAGDLALAGHAATVFERKSSAGGALFYGVPKYRLPKEVLAWDVGYVASLGVEIKVNSEIDAEAAQALVDGYDAVIIATGLPISRGLPIPGASAEGTHLALPFLEAANEGRPLSVKGKVIVVGGGNVAIDVARTALRTGAEKVSLFCLEGPTQKDLPAFSWEIEEAVEEGIEINPSWGPIEVTTRDGRVVGMQFKRCVRVFDERGLFSPAFDETQTTGVEADAVIFAIGQAGDVSFISGMADVDERGRLVFDRQRFTTSNPKVFAAGEVVTGPGAAIEAIAGGHRVAAAVDAYLGGRDIEALPEPPSVGELPEELTEKIAKAPRARSETLDPEGRVKGFMEVEATFPEEIAAREALRCLSCGNGAIADLEACAGCLTCVRVCPFEAPSVERTASMKADYCQACGLCAEACPARAVELGASDLRLLSGLFSGEARTAFVCREAVILPERRSSSGWQIISVPCAARIDETAVLKAFEAGSQGVLIVGCSDGRCRYGALEGLAGRVRKLRSLLDEVGLGGSRLGLTAETDIKAALHDFESALAARPSVEAVERK